MAALKSEVDTLNAAFQGWSFVLPAYKSANMTKTMDDLLKPLEAKAGGQVEVRQMSRAAAGLAARGRRDGRFGP